MKRDGGPLKIGLKYCGGCRAGYDRVALAGRIAARLGDKAVLVRPESDGIGTAVVIHGCPTACANLSALRNADVWMIGGAEDAERFVAHIQQQIERDAMALSREEIRNALKDWNRAWERFDLEGVMALMHADVLFENWTGGKAVGKNALRKAWQPWFAQGGFRFVEEETFIDEKEQKVLFRWLLEWPCTEPQCHGKIEKRRGVDVIHFQDGKIIHKLTYSKTTVEIDGQRHALHL
ncbi:MAG: nuclear transport factor 2 family protein [Desulfobacteraceae bacterium]|nr:MAG: nuclear transport factor 2 family protein [Desulfobacteraceae bacterium]